LRRGDGDRGEKACADRVGRRGRVTGTAFHADFREWTASGCFWGRSPDRPRPALHSDSGPDTAPWRQTNPPAPSAAVAGRCRARRPRRFRAAAKYPIIYYTTRARTVHENSAEFHCGPAGRRLLREPRHPGAGRNRNPFLRRPWRARAALPRRPAGISPSAPTDPARGTTTMPPAISRTWLRRATGMARPRRISTIARGARLDLPHDWAVEAPFDPEGPATVTDSRPSGAIFPERSVGWYRRTFTAPANDRGRRISVEFDGVFRDSIVWVNGFYLGRQPSGYTGFRYDLTDCLNYGGENVIAVRVDATMEEAGLTRAPASTGTLWLVRTAPLALSGIGARRSPPRPAKAPPRSAREPPWTNEGTGLRPSTLNRASRIPMDAWSPSGRREGPFARGGRDPASFPARSRWRIRALVARIARAAPARNDDTPGRRRGGPL